MDESKLLSGGGVECHFLGKLSGSNHSTVLWHEITVFTSNRSLLTESKRLQLLSEHLLLFQKRISQSFIECMCFRPDDVAPDGDRRASVAPGPLFGRMDEKLSYSLSPALFVDDKPNNFSEETRFEMHEETDVNPSAYGTPGCRDNDPVLRISFCQLDPRDNISGCGWITQFTR
jgi:hypothetical protein